MHPFDSTEVPLRANHRRRASFSFRAPPALKASASEHSVLPGQRDLCRVLMGNFVLVVSEGSFAGEATSFYDVFRVENGKIAEHWHTIEAIAPRADGRTRTVNSDYRIATPECSVLEELASTRD